MVLVWSLWSPLPAHICTLPRCHIRHVSPATGDTGHKTATQTAIRFLGAVNRFCSVIIFMHLKQIKNHLNYYDDTLPMLNYNFPVWMLDLVKRSFSVNFVHMPLCHVVSLVR